MNAKHPITARPEISHAREYREASAEKLFPVALRDSLDRHAADVDHRLGWREPDELSDGLTDRQRRANAVRLAAVRLVLGVEDRTETAVAEELGVSRAAVSKIVRDILTRLGFRQLNADAEHRARVSAALEKFHARKKCGSKGANSEGEK